jgi:hypothetical protein
MDIYITMLSFCNEQLTCFSGDLPTSPFTRGGDTGMAGAGGDNGPLGKVIGGGGGGGGGGGRLHGGEVGRCSMVSGGGGDGAACCCSGVGGGGGKSV